MTDTAITDLPLFAGRSRMSVNRRRRRMELSKPNHHQARTIRELERQATDSHPKRELMREWPALAASPKPVLHNPIKLAAQDVLALFDIHAPYHDSEFLTRVLDLAGAAGIKTLVLGGDCVDGTVFGRYGHAPDDTLEEELTSGENLFERFAVQFDDVVYLMGNHEVNRIFRTLESQMNVARFLRLFTHAENVRATPFEWVVMEGRDGDYPWLFAHPKNASVIAGRVPSMIASRQWTEHHVAMGHGHLWGMVQSDDGRRFCIDVGGCFDKDRIAYQRFSVNNRPAMHQGALIVKDGQPWLLHPKMDLEQLGRWFRSEAA